MATVPRGCQGVGNFRKLRCQATALAAVPSSVKLLDLSDTCLPLSFLTQTVISCFGYLWKRTRIPRFQSKLLPSSFLLPGPGKRWYPVMLTSSLPFLQMMLISDRSRWGKRTRVQFLALIHFSPYGESYLKLLLNS